MKTLSILIFFIGFPMFSSDTANDPIQLVNALIATHGGEQYNQMHMRFDFRDKQYTISKNNGVFLYERRFVKNTDTIIDQLSNSGFQRTVNGNPLEVSKEKSNLYGNALNSVVYFALLPYGLNDAAVNKHYLGDVEIANVRYDKVKVTFNEEGGGNDFEDVFVYWINQQTHTLDFLAYNFHVNGGGQRFRSAFQQRTVGGIRIQDYINYQPKTTAQAVEELDVLFINNELEELSRIELKNVTVKAINEE
jgi:hypothetical protein